jgi:hypothetical protein
MPRRTRNTTDTATKDDMFVPKATADTPSTEEQKKATAGADAAGWDAFNKLKEQARSGGDYISGKDDTWKPDEEEALVKFLDDVPFAVYYDIWVPAKNRSYSTNNDENPLSESLGLKPQPRALFNVLLADDNGWTLKALRATVMLAELIEKMANHDRHGPLSKEYWEMSATGSKKNYQPIMNVVRARDLEEEWGVQALTDEDISEYDEKRFTRDMVYTYSDQDLIDVVRELSRS